MSKKLKAGRRVKPDRPETIELPRGLSPKAKRCPLCDYALDTDKRRKMVEEKLREFNAHMEYQIAVAKGKAPGYGESKSGLILPTQQLKEGR
jgi:hypothetical protein